MDRFDAMQAFVRVVETGSFTKAAGTLHMSKTTVTQLVQQLEARLRVKLLNRTTRKVNVTADGAVFYERALRVLADLDDAETGLSAASAAPRGRLRVDVPSPFARMGVSDRMIDLIGENVDCVVRGGELTDQSLMARHITDLKLGVYAAPAYLQRAGTPDDPRDLEDLQHCIVGYRWARTGQLFPMVLQRDGERVQVQSRYLLSVDDGNAYLAAGLAGMGALWLPQYMAQPSVHSGELIALFDEWQLESMPMYVAFPPNRHISLKLRVFIDWVVELMGDGYNSRSHD
jgi:DNA-binding transcriptional LysR family regulator